ncbi:MAG TPA: apolipoprotein N-acyltransferase [Panacibacter sp.]|nr:apolipoprotein N-acyltransferase [Panacibacter sp.]
MKKLQPVGLSLLSGLLLYASWPVAPLTFLVFIAWLPLLYVAGSVEKKLTFFFYSFTTMLTWNACTTWWLWNSTDVGAIAAIIANSLIMTLPWWGYHIFKNKYGAKAGYFSLVVFWMLFEYIHLNWQLSWPWLTLGNVFASQPGWVQWYEYTGTSGGTLWVLLVNILLFNALIQWRNKTNKTYRLLIAVAVIILPFVISFIVNSKTENSKLTAIAQTSNNVIIVQPNIDPYDEKFDASTVSAQLELLISLSEKELDSNTRLVVWPETALSAGVWQPEFQNTQLYQPVFAFANRHPNVTLVTGIETYKSYGAVKETNSARLDEQDHSYYDVFNASVAIKANTALQFYNKSKLVPGVETLPDFLRFMSPVFEKFGGSTGGYGKSKESAVFGDKNSAYICAPIICYESIYGEYVGTYVAKGANILTVMTNDGWWGNTPGHKQHLDYARLRAIETRKWVVRSANTGISAVINTSGEFVATQPWDKSAYIKANVPAISGETFYVKYGDLLSKIASAFGVLLIAWNIAVNFRKRFFKKR